MQGAVQGCIACGVQCTTHQSTWRSFRDASEMHQKSMEFDMQGCTLTLCQPLGQSGSVKPPSLTTSGDISETPSQRLLLPGHSHLAPLLSLLQPLLLHPPPLPAIPPLPHQVHSPWTSIVLT